MTESGSKVYHVGVSFLELLALAFIVLRILGVIDWSWWVVLLPIYAPILLGVAGGVVLIAIDVAGRRR